MSRPTPLVVRWKKWQAKKRRSSYYGRGLQKGAPKGPFLRDMDTVAYSKHATSTRHADLCRLFDLQYQEPIHGYQVKQRDRAAFELFKKPVKMEDPQDFDAKLAVEDRIQELYLLNHDPRYRFLRFSFFYKIGGANTPFNLSVHFQGTEYFLVEQRNGKLRRSVIYSSKERMLLLYEQLKITWANTIDVTTE